MFIWQKRNSKRCRATCKQGHYYASHIVIVKFCQNKVVDVFTGWTCNSIYDMANWLLHVSQIFVLDSNWLSSKTRTVFSNLDSGSRMSLCNYIYLHKWYALYSRSNIWTNLQFFELVCIKGKAWFVLLIQHWE